MARKRKRYEEKDHDGEIEDVLENMGNLLNVLDNLGSQVYDLLWTDGEEDPVFRLRALLKNLDLIYRITDFRHILNNANVDDGFPGPNPKPKQEGVRVLKI